MEFEQALSVIKKRDDQKQQQRQQDLAHTGQSDASGSRDMVATPSGGDSRSSKKPFSFNPNAKDFSFNASAATFTPGGAAGSPVAAPSPAESQQSPAVKTSGPPFTIFSSSTEQSRLTLDNILDKFVGRSNRSDMPRAAEDVSWTAANGPSFKEILGQPNPMMPIGQLNNGQMPGQAQTWQPGMGQMGAPQPPGQPAQPQMAVQQGQTGAPGGQAPGQPGAPQMMGQQGFMVGGAPGGQPGQMFQPMYPAPAGSAPQGMRPQGGGGQMQAQGQQMVYSNQGQQMAVPVGQQMAMPGQMMQGGQNQGSGNMGNMPKFGMPGNMPQGGMVMMMPQNGAQGQVMMMPQQSMLQGQPGQPGQHGHQGQPGQPNQMRPMYQGQMSGGQMGGGGPPHQMPGHEG